MDSYLELHFKGGVLLNDKDHYAEFKVCKVEQGRSFIHTSTRFAVYSYARPVEKDYIALSFGLSWIIDYLESHLNYRPQKLKIIAPDIGIVGQMNNIYQCYLPRDKIFKKQCDDALVKLRLHYNIPCHIVFENTSLAKLHK